MTLFGYAKGAQMPSELPELPAGTSHFPFAVTLPSQATLPSLELPGYGHRPWRLDITTKEALRIKYAAPWFSEANGGGPVPVETRVSRPVGLFCAGTLDIDARLNTSILVPGDTLTLTLTLTNNSRVSITNLNFKLMRHSKFQTRGSSTVWSRGKVAGERDREWRLGPGETREWKVGLVVPESAAPTLATAQGIEVNYKPRLVIHHSGLSRKVVVKLPKLTVACLRNQAAYDAIQRA